LLAATLTRSAEDQVMERAEWLDLAATEALGFPARFELAKAHCALVFEERGGKLTDADVVAVARCWGAGDERSLDVDTDLLAGHLFAWLG
jgi:hypothetical protein